MSRKRTTTQTLFALADVLTSVANTGAHLVGALERNKYRKQVETLQALKIENQRLKNENLIQKTRTEEHRTAKTSNDVVIGDIKIELLQLALRREQWKQHNAGVGTPQFVAEGYPEPGDVRRGILPPGEK